MSDAVVVAFALMLVVSIAGDGRLALVCSILCLAFVPVNYRITPAVLFFAMWAIVGMFPHRGRDSWRAPTVAPAAFPRAPGIIFIALLLLLWSTVSADSEASWQWVVIAIFCVVVPFASELSRRKPTWATTAVVLAVVAVAAAIFAVLESTVGFNPWRAVYSSSVLAREWSVTRVIVGFGHPLVVMVFAVTVGSMSVARWVRLRRPIWILPAAACVILLWLSVTRSGLGALAVGVAVGLLPAAFSLRSKSRKLAVGAITVGTIAVYLVANSALFETRSTSIDGTSSLDYRLETYGPILQAIADHWLLGVGPGAGQSSMMLTSTPNIESSALQLALGLGLPLFVVVCCCAVWLVVTGLRRGHVEASAGLVAYLVAMSTWNALDTNPALMVLLGLLILGCREVPQVSQVNGEDRGQSVPDFSQNSEVDRGSGLHAPATPRGPAAAFVPTSFRSRAST